MSGDLADTIFRHAAQVISGGILVNVLDDAFVDARYIVARLARRDRRVVSEDALATVAQKRIAIMLPAWKESDVIERMLEHNVGTLDYDARNIDIFCGTYQNDPETQACVDAAARRFPNVHKVVVPHDGPTSKADCLNWVYQGLILEERRRGRRFEILLMQDAEDLIHPQALRLYSLLIPPNEFVQTPVFSVPLPKSRVVSATYIDEFAEHHLKDMLVRESIGGLVPSAGVGSAFDRDAFEEIATAHGQHPFNVDSLTEDYEIGLKFRLANRKTHFACRSIERRDEKGRLREEFIATRELFPGGFSASVRQRSRWILGITLQTWAQIGWQGAFAVLYCLWRDRKALITNTLLLAAYSLMAYVVGRTLFGQLFDVPWHVSDVVHPGSALAWMLLVNLVFAVWRIAVKAHFVGKLYGGGHAALSLPRLMLSNVIGVIATARAVSQYLGHRLSGKPLRWLKTAHEFPTFERLARRWRRLGEVLLDRAAVTAAELDEALSAQRSTGARLGDILAISGIVSHAEVTEAIGLQLGIATADPTIRVPRELLRRLPEALAEELDVLPLQALDDEVVVAIAEPLGDDARARLEAALGARITARLAPREAIRQARERAYRRLLSERSIIRLPRPVLHAGVADRRLVARLGTPFCAFHRVIPVKSYASRLTRILSAAPVHAWVHREIERRLAAKVGYELTSPVAFRVLLASVERLIPRGVDAAGLSGLDALEWEALARELGASTPLRPHRGVPPALDVLAREARGKGISPFEYVAQVGAASPLALARARARTFGLGLAERGGSCAGVLPARMTASHDVTLLARDADSIHLISPRPTPRLAQQVASLLSPVKVAWSVTPSVE